MCEQTEINYLDGEVVWVKLGSCWWPGAVVGADKLPPDVLPSFRKPPIAVVKFFQESTYEYVKNINSIYKYNCSRKHEFIKKGILMYRSKHGHMEKFPEDVIRAETETGGDPDILTSDEFQEAKKESYAGIFGSASKKTATPGRGRGRQPNTPKSSNSATPIRRVNREKSDYKVHILVQGSKTPSQPSDALSTPSTSRAGSETETVEEKTPKADKPVSTFTTPTSGAAGVYPCPLCAFTTTRLNVLILHNKTHSATFTPYTPSPVRKKPTAKVSPKSTPNKTPKARKPRAEKPEKEKVVKKSQAQKRPTEEPPEPVEVKKPKTDEEIKSSLLADWDDMDEDSNDKSPEVATSPEVAVAAASPAELPTPPVGAVDNKSNDTPVPEKPESSSDSKYEFCEDEDWSLEADAGRKIPRVKNPAKRKEERKSISIDEDDVAREVAELLNRTTVPELPVAPEPLTVEENFPEPSIVKSPDKKTQVLPETSKVAEKVPEPQPTKAIFKTKTFFRSRHSRSQDAIGKYVAEQLNAAERMDAESELNGSEMASSPEARESPPIEPVKVARLAPKIQLKKMKAEAAQLREKEKYNFESAVEENHAANGANIRSENLVIKNVVPAEIKEVVWKSSHQPNQDVLYPTQEIKPINKDKPENNFLVNEIKQTYNNISDDNTHSLPRDETDQTDSQIKEPLMKQIETINKYSTLSDVYDNITKRICDNIEKSNETDEKLDQASEKHGSVKNDEEKTGLSEIPESEQKPREPLVETFMNESTASAVDALLSVSREADRVTKVISDDPPEDLFEDDNKDNGINNNINGFNEAANKANPHLEDVPMSVEEDKYTGENVSSEITLKETSEHQGDIIPQQNYLNETNNELTHNDTLLGDPQASKDVCELVSETVVDSTPSESDLQIAEALINLPSTAIQNNATSQLQQNLNLSSHFASEAYHEEVVQTMDNVDKNDDLSGEVRSEGNVVVEHVTESLLPSNNDNLNSRYETEEEKSLNLNAAQSLVEMSESIDHKIKVSEPKLSEVDNMSALEPISTVQSTLVETNHTVEQKLASLSPDNSNDPSSKTAKFETTPSKLLKILEEPCIPKSISKTPTKQLIMTGKEKILNFDVNKSTVKSKPSQSPKQQIIIRRNTPNKNLINSINEISSQDNIILSRTSKPPQDGSSVQTYTIQATPDTPSDANTIIIQQKIRKITKTAPKLQKLKQQYSLVTPVNESKTVAEQSTTDDTFYDINSMPIVLSDDLTPENIEKMPIVMSDGKIITNPTNPPKLIKTKPIESEKVIMPSQSKPELKTLLMNPVPEVSKSTTPNILSKSSKLRASKPMLVIDKATGKQKIIMTKADPTVKEIKQAPAKIEPVAQTAAKPGKFIILPTASSPRPNRTQKIVIDPQTGKAHVLVAKATEPQQVVPENKPVSAKLVPQPTDAGAPGSTVMIITNAQGTQSRIVLTPEHEKILFPNKQQPKVSQLKTVTHRITTNSPQKTIVSSVAAKTPPTKIVPKQQQQKSAIITSKGQLIVGGRVATTAQNIAPMPEIRPKQRIIAAEPKKLAQTIQKTSSEPLIFLQQKSGAVMQLTTAQFEHLQRTGQIVHKTAVPENKIVVQKQITISSNEAISPAVHKKMRRPATMSPTPAKKPKQEIAIAPAPAPAPATLAAAAPAPAPVPALTPLSHAAPPPAAYSELDNFEELLPSTAIARPASPAAPEPPAPAPAAPLADGQLLAVPGEHFGGPPGSFYLCVEDNGSLTPIDNRPLVLENNQLVPMGPEPAPAPERRDILEAALANSDVFHEPPREDAPFRDLNANVSVHCRVSETSTTLHQPIMTPVEVPSHADAEPAVPHTLEDGLAVIGVTPHTVPTSLELPITVTDPRIAPRVGDPLAMLEPAQSMSMPLLLEEEPVGKSLPMLTDEPAGSAGSSGSDEALWSRRLLTPGSDASDLSAEIPLQPAMRLSVDDLARTS